MVNVGGPDSQETGADSPESRGERSGGHRLQTVSPVAGWLRTPSFAPDPTPPPDLVPLRLVPVCVFGAGCGTEEHIATCPDCGYGLCDAVSSWSDCNRAIGRIYRVDDTRPEHRQPGETVTVWVPRDQLCWFDKRWAED